MVVFSKSVMIIATMILILGAGAAEAETLIFSDNFDHGNGYSYDVNLNYLSPLRQSGSAGHLTYEERPETKPGQSLMGAVILSHPWEDPKTLNFFTNNIWGNPFAYPWVSPNHSFIESGNLVIEFDVDPLGPSSTSAIHSAGVVFGTDVQGAYFVPGSGLLGTTASAGVGITLTSDGVWAVYEDNNSAPLASGGVTPHSGYYHVQIRLEAKAFDGSPALISLNIDGQQVHSYIRAHGFTSNYITLAGLGDGSPYQIHVFDNLLVTADLTSTSSKSISSVKHLPNESLVFLTNKVLYLKEGSFGYIEEQDRSSGIRVEGTITATEGQMVAVAGKMRTSPGGERYIQLNTISGSIYSELKPLGTNNKSLHGRSMDGLYVKTWGKVKPGSVTSNSFVITDGSDTAGIKVITSDSPGVSGGAFVNVSGAAGMDSSRVIYRDSELPYEVYTKRVEQSEKNIADFFPYGVWYHNVFTKTPVETQSAANALFADFSAHNINSILGGGCWTHHRQLFINAAQTYNLKLVMAMGVGGYDESVEGDMPAHDRLHEIFRKQVKDMGSLINNPHIIGWYGDEPPIGKEQKYVNFISTLYEEDPFHPQFICLVGNTISSFYTAIRPKNVLLFDAYFIGGTNGVGNFRHAMYGGQDLAQHIDQVRGYIHPKDDTPMWIVLQAHNDLTYDQNGQMYEALRIPKPEEIRLQTWLALAHGAHGISWFMYPIYPQGAGLPDRLCLQNTPANYTEVGVIGAKMKVLGPTITKLSVTQNIASITGGGNAYYPTGDVQTHINDSPYRTPFVTGQDHAFTLSADTAVVADSDASDGRSVRIPNTSSAKTVKWFWPSSGFKPGVEYDLYVSLKVRHTISGYQLPTGNAFTIGVHNDQGGDVVSPTHISGEISKPLVYRQYKIGTFVPSAAKYVFVSGVNNQSNYPEVYIDKFYFVEKGDKYLIAANRNCENSSNITLRFPLSTADKYGKGLLDVVDVYNGKIMPKAVNNGTVTFWPNLAPGDGAVFQLRSME